ncbi:MAG: hypothetical protein VKJ04_00275, partial [Vampirovibrionales bacterium]|nr:hypothetical protein [Vampirovibrionales bacterium]
MPSMEQLKTVGRAYGHWIEQPAVLYKAEKIAYGLGGVGILGLGAADVFRAKSPQERKKIAIRDTSILGLTGLFTFLAAMKFMRPVDLKELAEDVIPPIKEHLPRLKQKYPDIKHLLDKLLHVNEKAITDGQKSSFWSTQVKDHLSKDELKELVGALRKNGKQGKADLDSILPIDDAGSGHFFKDVWEDWKKAISFFGVGLVACVSGLGGGLFANKLNNTSSQEATANMVKEGIFQFIANIALCAVGAMIAMATLNIPAVRKAIGKLGS